MLPLRTILHPTDFSEQAGYAYQLAGALARDYQARLVVLHVMPQPVIVYGEGVAPPDPEFHREVQRKKLAELPDIAGVNTERLLVDGDAVSTIAQVAAKSPCDLIVMGTHGRSGMGRLLMGSVAEGVLRKAPCPVLTVKTPIPECEVPKPANEDRTSEPPRVAVA